MLLLLTVMMLHNTAVVGRNIDRTKERMKSMRKQPAEGIHQSVCWVMSVQTIAEAPCWHPPPPTHPRRSKCTRFVEQSMFPRRDDASTAIVGLVACRVVSCHGGSQQN